MLVSGNKLIMGSAMPIPMEVRVHMTQPQRPRQFWNNDEPDEMIVMPCGGEDPKIELRPAQPIEWYPGPDMIAEMCPQTLWQISDDCVYCMHNEACIMKHASFSMLNDHMTIHREGRNMMHSNVTKLTVNVTPAAMAALNAASGDLGDTQTDTINRALQLYRHITTLAPGESVSFDRLPGERVTLTRTTTSNGTVA